MDIDVVGHAAAQAGDRLRQVVKDREADQLAVDARAEDLGGAVLKQRLGVVVIGAAGGAALERLRVGRQQRSELMRVVQPKKRDVDLRRVSHASP